MTDHLETDFGSIENELNKIAVMNFIKYLQIPTVHPDINYNDAVEFLKQQAKTLDLPVEVHHVFPKNPIVIITWKGTDPTLPSIFLNSHMDVVPVFEEQWTYPPFGAKVDELGNIYARGSQDMKCVGIQYLEAIRRMRARGKRPKRTIHVSFVPDEEVGGNLGMKEFVKTKEFKALNVGFSLDEGMANETTEYNLYYGERSARKIQVHCPGNPGHGSLLLDNTAGEKLRVVIDKFMDFRAKQKARLLDPKVKLGDITSVNLTILHGGVLANVIPNNLTVTFDVRLSPNVNHEEFENVLKKWCEDAGEGVHYTFLEKNKYIESTKLDDSNIYWLAFKRACDSERMKLKIEILPASNDSRYLRDLGIPAICFSPMNETKILLHDHNECLNVKVLLKGIKIYQSIIDQVANC